MEFHAVIAEPVPDPETGVVGQPTSLYVGTDAVAAQKAYDAHDAGRVSHFRLHQSQAFESRDLSIRHGVVSGTAKPAPEVKRATLASDLPGPKPGEVIHDEGTGQDLIRPAANPHQLNTLPTDPAARAQAIKEAQDYRDGVLATEVAPPDPDRAKLIEDERAAAEEADRKRIEEANSLLVPKATKKTAK